VPPPDCQQARLHPAHQLNKFVCGNSALDDWLRRHALNADKMGTARTYVWTDKDHALAAYFSLAPHLVSRVDVNPRVGRGSPDSIPSILLAKLALHEARHGRGEGSLLLVDALAVAIGGIRDVGGRLIVVDAIDDEAAAFHQKHGFVLCPGRADRLVVKASDAAVSLRLPWP
jgi:GNAT superfamily N-acetyltransferase